MRIILLLLYGLLFAGTSSFAATGPEVAQLLNRRYQSSVAECVGDHPAFFCSGVLLRASAPSVEFWKHGTVATQLGAESFAFMRADVGTRQAGQNGVVFADPFTAIGWGRSVEVLCAYPFEFPLPGTRADFGCGLPSVAANQDVSSCAALGISDAPQWLVHFQQQNQQPERQCSLSSSVPGQFRASLIAHQGLTAEWSARATLLQVKNWDANLPAQLPLQGLFYDVNKTGALLGAQKDQRDYFTATGDWLPILRMNLNQGPDRVFGFNQQDQLYIGYQVASRLNARYADTSMACRGDSPAYNCNGVLIRTTDASPAFHAWNPSPGSVERNGVSFSYMRADVKLPILAWAKNEGLIMKELAGPTSYPLTLRCSFPHDGATFYRTDSCNQYTGRPLASGPCAPQGITTPQAYITHLYAQADKYAGCSFTGETGPFETSILARALMNPAEQRIHNEVIIANWPQDIPRQLPLEAFFYVSADGKPNARFFQRDYFEQTSRYLPILRVDLAATDGQVFFFDPLDQALETSSENLIKGIVPRHQIVIRSRDEHRQPLVRTVRSDSSPPRPFIAQ